MSDFSIIAYLIVGKNGYKISSINHYNTYFKHQEILKEKLEDLNYNQYGSNKYVEEVGYDRYCKDIWKVARDPKTLHTIKYKIKEKSDYFGEPIEQGDIIKIGRIKFKLRKFNLNKKASPFKVAKEAMNDIVQPGPELGRHSCLINKNYKKEVAVEKNEEIPPCRF